MNVDRFVYYRDRVCVPNDDELKKSILEEAHSGSFAMNPSSLKGFKYFILVVRNEKRCIEICDQVYDVLESEGRRSSSFGIIAAY